MKLTLHALFGLFFFLFSPCLQAQDTSYSFKTTYTKTFGGSGNEGGGQLKSTNDGHYIMSGATNSFGSGDYDFWLLKFNLMGDSLWSKSFGGVDYDQCYNTIQTKDSGYVMIGYTNSFGSGNEDVWLVKADSTGDSLWSKTYGGTDDERGIDIIQTSDNGFIIIADTKSFGAGNRDLWLIKTDENGDSTWSKLFGGTQDDQGLDIIKTNDGGYLIAGYTHSFTNGARDAWLLKFNASFEKQWEKHYGGAEDNILRYVLQDENDNFYMVGDNGSFQTRDLMIMKANANGDSLWMKSYNGIEEDWGTGAFFDVNKNLVISAFSRPYPTSNYDIWLVLANPDGDTLKTLTYGGPNWDAARGILPASDGEFFIAGETYSYGAGPSDIWLLKIQEEISDVEEFSYQKPAVFTLEQNYPNPFNPSTTIKFTLKQRSRVELSVYNVLGQQVRNLVRETKPAGNYQKRWDGLDNRGQKVSSGMYFYKLNTNDYSKTLKMILMK
jgi:hypothetical protein